MKKKFCALIALSVLLFPSLALCKKAPDWIEGSSKQYPEPRYFIGVGSVKMDKGGEKQQEGWAADRARAEIAKTVRSKIETTTTLSRIVKSEGGSPETRATQTDIVIASANEILEDVEIKAYYRDKKTKTVYALAVLDRPLAAERIQKKADSLKQMLLTEMEEGKSFQDKGEILPSIRHYNKALLLSQDVSKNYELITALLPGSVQPESVMGYEADIKKILYGLKKLIRFDVQVEGPASAVRSYIIGGLAGGGFIAVSGAAAQKTYLLTGTTDLNYKGDMQMAPDLTVQIYQADLDLEIKDPATNESLGSLTWSASANEKTENMASKSAVRALGRTVQKDIAEKILNLF